MKSLGSLAALALLTQASGALAQDVGDAGKGREYAQRVCASCHAVLPEHDVSPAPKATPFKIIANTPGMTGTALTVWLTNPHPTMPNLGITERDRYDVIAYILTLHQK